MNRMLLLLLFVVLYSAQTLNLNLSLAPGVSVKNAILYAMFGLLALQAAVGQQRKLELLPVLGPLSLYVAYAICMWLAVLLIMQYPGYGFMASVVPLKNGPVEDLMILLVSFYALTTVKDAIWALRGILWIVIAGNVITVVDTLGIVNLGVIDMRDDGRAGGPIGAANQFAAFLALCLPMMAALWWLETGIKKHLVGLGLAISMLAFLLTVSRAGVLGLAVGGVIALILLRKVIPGQLLMRGVVTAMGLGVVAVAALFLSGYADLMWERFGQLEGSASYATSGRSEIWARLLGTMLEHPMSLITGFGWWAYQTDLAMGLYRFSPHNTYLEVLYDLGLIGLTLYMVVLINVVRTARAAVANASPEALPWLIGFITGFLALLIAMFFGPVHSIFLYAWAIAGITLRIAVESRSAQPASAPEPRTARPEWAPRPVTAPRVVSTAPPRHWSGS